MPYKEELEGMHVLAFEPPRVRRIFVETAAGETAEIYAPLPTVILLGKRNEYYLWAAKGKTVSAKTSLAVAPLPNIGDEWRGKICFGKNEVPEVRADAVDAIWNLIFSAPFSSHSANGKCRSECEDVRKLLFALAQNGAKTFPARELIEFTTTVEEAWAAIVENKRFASF